MSRVMEVLRRTIEEDWPDTFDGWTKNQDDLDRRLEKFTDLCPCEIDSFNINDYIQDPGGTSFWRFFSDN